MEEDEMQNKKLFMYCCAMLMKRIDSLRYCWILCIARSEKYKWWKDVFDMYLYRNVTVQHWLLTNKRFFPTYRGIRDFGCSHRNSFVQRSLKNVDPSTALRTLKKKEPPFPLKCRRASVPFKSKALLDSIIWTLQQPPWTEKLVIGRKVSNIKI